MPTEKAIPRDPPPETETVIQRALASHAGEPGALLPVLHDIQDALGWLPPPVIPAVASALSLSRAEVHGVITFYHDFRTEPPGRTVVKLCAAEACKALGADALAEHACARLEVSMGATRADGAFTLLPVYCLGNCALSPAVMIDGRLFGNVTPERFDALVSRERP